MPNAGSDRADRGWLVTLLMTSAVLGAAVFVFIARERRPDPCGDHHALASGVVPSSSGFRLISNVSVAPDCGGRFRRVGVFTRTRAAAEPLLTSFVAGLDDDEWQSSGCANASSRCFRWPRRHLFLAVSEDPDQRPSGPGPQIRVVVQSCAGREGC